MNSDGGCENRSNNLHAFCIPPAMFFSVRHGLCFQVVSSLNVLLFTDFMRHAAPFAGVNSA